MAPSRNPEGLIYSNLIHSPIDSGNIYSNLPSTNPSYANGGRILSAYFIL